MTGLPSSARRLIYLVVGWMSVVAGVIGIVVPVWPTTCFLLLAGWCFARSSKRAEEWLYRNHLFGRHLAAYRDRKVISTRVRLGSLVVLWSAIGVSAVLVAQTVWLVVLLILIAGVVTLHVCSLPSEGTKGVAG